MVKTTYLQCKGHRFYLWSGELISHMLCGQKHKLINKSFNTLTYLRFIAVFTDYFMVCMFPSSNIILYYFCLKLEVFKQQPSLQRMNPERILLIAFCFKKMRSTKISVPYYFLDGETLYSMMQKMFSFLLNS